MKWHQGTIVEAVAAAKADRLVFVVYIHGKDEQSNQMNESLNESSLTDTLAAKCVALKLETESEGAKQFAQIYPVVIIPSLFFIGANGLPLEVIGGYVEPTKLSEKVNTILDLHEKQKESSACGGSSSSDSKAACDVGESSKTSPSNSNETLSESSNSSTENKLESESVTRENSTTANDSNQEQIDLENRVQRAKDLIAQKQQLKAKEEFEKEKQKEIERRQLGKNMQDLKQRQKDMETKKIAEEIARERAEEQAAREKIRQQIARDRAERANKYQMEKDAEEVRKQEALQAQRDRANAEAINRSCNARLQFKLPDGTPVVQQFSADAQLQEVYNFVKENVKPPFASFRLCLIFPRRDFHKGDYSQTLRDLQLVPSASLLILPESNSSAVQPSSGANWIWTLLSPLLAMWKFFYNIVFGAPNARPPAQARNTPPPSGSSGGNESGRPELKRQRLSPRDDSNRPFTRREGNVHRIADENDDDEENNTWNGNSTQQM